ncbi:MAG: hypothetical protein FJ033_16425 [Chloroflexi bacterium]|nr:hypothetical protein [Chloroflexota bacterium]
MGDFRGSHSWLVDPGAGSSRVDTRRGGASVARSSDEEIGRVIGRRIDRRESLRSGIERIHLHGSDPRTAILKTQGMLVVSSEAALYAGEILDPAVDGSPRLLASSDQGWILLEDCGETRPPLGDPIAMEAVFHHLGDVHRRHCARMAGSRAKRSGMGSSPLVRTLGEGQGALDQLVASVDRARQSPQAWELTGEDVLLARQIRDWGDRVGVSLLDGAWESLLHGDYHVGNWLLQGGRVRVLDWELAGPGPAFLDLQYLDLSEGPPLHGPRGAVARRALDAYFAALGGSSVPFADRPSVCRAATIWCAVGGALQYLEALLTDADFARGGTESLPGAAAARLRLAAKLAALN